LTPTQAPDAAELARSGIGDDMKRVALLAIAIACAPRQSSAQEVKDIQGLRKAKGMPVFVARSTEARGNLIVCKGLELVEPAEDQSDKKFRGRVLFYCDPWDALWLWVAHSDQQMHRAVPFLGLEKPGAKLADLPPPKLPGPAELLRPARLFMATVDEKGRIVRTANIVVHKLQAND
jgi:hypothetical protein